MEKSLMEQLVGRIILADYHHKDHYYDMHEMVAGSAARCAECGQWYDRNDMVWIVNDLTDKSGFGTFDSQECAYNYIHAR